MGCPGPEPIESAQAGSVVLGLSADDLLGYVNTLNVETSVDGKVVSTERIDLKVAAGAQPLPKEVRVRSESGAGVVSFRIDGRQGDVATDPVVLSRLVSSTVVSGQERLLRVRLEQRCITPAGLRTPPGAFVPTGPTCAAPSTCIAGACTSSEVPPSATEPYRADWASSPPDICRPAGAGDPEVILGSGQTDYAQLKDGDTLQIEKGPQGGHHLWIALRMRNLRQSGSTTTITGVLPESPASTIQPTAFVFSFDPDEGGYCKLYGLRFQLDSGAANLAEDYKRFLGKPIDVTVTVRDTAGRVGQSKRRINIASKILCPSGLSCE